MRPTPQSPCPDADELVELVARRLVASAAIRLEQHLDACQMCRQAVATLLWDIDPQSGSRLGTTTSPSRDGTSSGTSSSGAAAIASPLLPGDIVDQYRVEELLGAGGMAFVYLARDRVLGRRVALKVLRARVRTPRQHDELVSEARTTARFQHPNIVTVYGAGESRGHAYLALEYVDGLTLRERMSSERLPWRDVVRIALAVVGALAAAHAVGIVHCDLKPSNVLMAKNGRILVLDFGLARTLAYDARAADAPPIPSGTPVYMAPEQWGSDAPTPATDVWALGVILFELLAERRPFEGTTARELRRAVQEGDLPSALPHHVAPGGLASLVQRCLERDVARRPSLAELEHGLEQLLAPQVHDATSKPFRGLLPFEEADARMFFGRDAEISAAVERLRSEPLLVVLGASGVGKSSFVRAGLIPRLREHRSVTVIELRPGRDPFTSLARALAAEGIDAGAIRDTPARLAMLLDEHAKKTDRQVVLFVDQMEETFGLSERVAAGSFSRCVLAAADAAQAPVRVILSLREDFLSRLANCIGDALSGLLVLACPGPKALVESLRRPVAAHGYRWEPPELVDEMVDAVAGESAALPLLQFAAEQLWLDRNETLCSLGQPGYERIGGVGGALAECGDRVLVELGENAPVARQIFLRLLAPDGTRRVLSRHRLLDGLPPAGDVVLERLIAARLVSLRVDDAETEIEIAHESLVNGWLRLRRWLDASREERATLAEVEHAALFWERRGSRDDQAWRGPDLAEAVRAARSATAVPAAVTRFLAAGERLERQTLRARRRIQAAIVFVLVSIAVGALIVSFAFHAQRREAESRRDEAVLARRRAQEREAEALREAADAALARGDLLEARAKAQASIELFDDPRTRLLVWRMLAHPVEWSRTMPGPTLSSDLAPDGRRVAASVGRDVHLIDPATGELERRLTGHTDTIVAVRFSPDGAWLASGGMDGRILLFTSDGELVARLVENAEGVNALTFSPVSPRSGLLAAAGGGGTIRVFDLRSRETVATLHAGTATITTLAFDVSGEHLWSSGNDGLVREWDVGRAALVRVLGEDPAGVQSLALSTDGATLASGGTSGTLIGWDLATGREKSRVRAHRSLVHALAFEPTSGRLFSGGHDHVLRIWELDGSPRSGGGDQGAAVWDLRFGPNHRMVVTSGDRKVRLMSVAPERAFDPEPPIGHSSFVDSVAFSPDGRVLASGSNDRTVRLWDVSSGAELRVLRGHEARVWAVQFSRDGRLVASASEDQTVRIWDRFTGTQLRVLAGDGGSVYSITFEEGGRFLASTSKDGRLRLWDLASGALVRSWPTHDEGIARFTPDGAHLVTAGIGGIRIWTLAGTLMRRLEVKGTLRGLAVNAAGDVAAIADGDVRVWHLETGENRHVGWLTGRRIDELSFDAASAELLATTPEGSVQRWSLSGSSPAPIQAHHGSASALAADPLGRFIATGGDDGTVRLFHLDGRSAWGSSTSAGPAPDSAATPAAAVDASGWRATAKPLGAIELASPSGKSMVLESKGSTSSEVTAIALGKDGIVAAGHVGGEVRLWHPTAGLLVDRRLHGSVRQLSLSLSHDHAQLVATAELGSTVSMDLRWLALGRCEFLEDLADRQRSQGLGDLREPVPRESRGQDHRASTGVPSRVCGE